MSHMTFDLWANTLALTFKAMRVSSIVSLLIAMNFRVLSAVNGEIVLIVIASITEDTVKSSWPEMKKLYSSLRLLKYSGPFLGLSSAHAEIDGIVANGSFSWGSSVKAGWYSPHETRKTNSQKT